MARIARVVIPGNPHHVVQRGVRSMDVFHSDADREAYLNLLRRMSNRYHLSFWAWCLMSNHVHLVAVPKREDSLSRAIGEAHRRYTRRINLRENVRGHLFQERFYSCPIQQDSHLLAVTRYVELNPVNAGLAETPEQYRWSSARYHVTGKPDRLVASSPIRQMVTQWKGFLQDEVENARRTKEIERHLRSGRPWGERAWLENLEQTTGRALIPAKRGRHPKRGQYTF